MIFLEGFGRANKTIDQKIKLILLIQNIGVGQGNFNLDRDMPERKFPILYSLMGDDGLIDIPNKMPKLSMAEKGHTEELYNYLDKRFGISALPDLSDIRRHFYDVVDIGFNLEESIVLLKPGTSKPYGKISMDQSHYKIRVSIIHDESQMGMQSFFDLQETIEATMIKLEGNYKSELVVGGDAKWTDFKILITSYK